MPEKKATRTIQVDVTDDVYRAIAHKAVDRDCRPGDIVAEMLASFAPPSRAAISPIPPMVDADVADKNSNAAKRQRVLRLLVDPKTCNLNNQEIARIASVSDTFVRTMRKIGTTQEERQEACGLKAAELLSALLDVWDGTPITGRDLFAKVSTTVIGERLRAEYPAPTPSHLARWLSPLVGLTFDCMVLHYMPAHQVPDQDGKGNLGRWYMHVL